MTSWQARGDSRGAGSTGAGLGERRLLVTQDRAAELDEALLDAVEEHVAARLGDVEQTDRLAAQRLSAVPAAKRCRTVRSLVGSSSRPAHRTTFLVTGWEPSSPFAHPPIMAENNPAPTTGVHQQQAVGAELAKGLHRQRNSGYSFSHVAPRHERALGRGSAGGSWSSASNRSRSQPASLNTRACSGPTTRMQSKPEHELRMMKACGGKQRGCWPAGPGRRAN